MTCLECVIFMNIFCSIFLMLSLASTLSHSSTTRYSVCIDQDLPYPKGATPHLRKFAIALEFLLQYEVSIICCIAVISVSRWVVLRKSTQFSNLDFWNICQICGNPWKFGGPARECEQPQCNWEEYSYHWSLTVGWALRWWTLQSYPYPISPGIEDLCLAWW